MNNKMNQRQHKKHYVPKKSNEVLYSKSLITRSIKLDINSIGKNIIITLLQKIRDDYEGKCVVEGYIQPGTCNIKGYSSGLLKSNYVIYEVLFECLTCFPVQGMLIECVAINITKAGIRAEINTDKKPSPAIVFITRDHNYNVDEFSKIKEGDIFEARVIGQRFELNDKFVSIIAKLTSKTKEHHKPQLKKKTINTNTIVSKKDILDKLVSVIPKVSVVPTNIEKENGDEEEDEKKDEGEEDMEEEEEEEENEDEDDEEDEEEDEEDEEEGNKLEKPKKEEY
jgi:DNA-directed RNA polymerase subunit E'/Rpb7